MEMHERYELRATPFKTAAVPEVSIDFGVGEENVAIEHAEGLRRMDMYAKITIDRVTEVRVWSCFSAGPR